MKEEQIASWIFLAVSMASESRPADLDQISRVANGILHHVPSHLELKSAISWLKSNGWVSRVEQKYELTDLGKTEYEKASNASDTLANLTETIAQRLKAIG